MRSSLLLSFLLAKLLLSAQTGPGGVGTSTNNVLWLSADQGITESGGLVSAWSDRSGNNNHAYPPGAIPGARPSYVVNSANGYPALDFDGSDDQLWVQDHSSIDLTQWHFFMVLRVDLQKDYNAWMVKGDDSDENFEVLSYNDGNIHAPTKYSDGTRTHPSTAGGQVTTSGFNIIEYSYRSADGRDIYKNGSSIHTDNENKTPRTNNLPLYIGNERSTSGRELNGDIAELIAYNAPLNATQRILLNNSISAKYGLTLSASDLYVQDDPANGNYDHEVAGIGRISSSDQHNDSKGSGVVRMNNPSGLNNNEFLLWGHNNAPMDAWGVTDYPVSIEGRVARVWRVSEVNGTGSAVNVGNVDIIFDLNGLGSVTASDLRLLVDTDNDGLFADETPIAGATGIGGGNYRFAAVSALRNGRRFTLGTNNGSTTPLPIELLSFTATDASDEVRLDWATASEANNAFFTVERSGDLERWEDVVEVAGAGNSKQRLDYAAHDHSPLNGTSYYRLRQTDTDGSSELSAAVAITRTSTIEAYIYPMPFQDRVVVETPNEQLLSVDLFNMAGQRLKVPMEGSSDRTTLDTYTLPSGSYVIHVLTEKGALTSTIVKGQ
ncbi:MAG: T9SS type A sorting domain-containing protein [Flavobacteriales bacterium]|nr:T9SS type A sorting domain-containing protein [Flavobacteriales bacterium]